MAPYPKPYKSIADLLHLLQQRGMQVPDPQRATRCLERVGYYRLSGYWYPMRRSHQDQAGKVVIEQDFRPGSSFSHAADLYVFDKRLRLLVLDAIERIEVGLKVQIARILGQRDPLAYLNPLELNGSFSKKTKRGPTLHEEWIAAYRRNERRSREDFIDPFLKNHTGYEFPIWMAIEVWDFGNLSHFLPGMKTQDRMTLANNFGLPRDDLLVSWVRSIHHVRNTCAHHSRLWNRPLVDNPKPPKAGDHPLLDHLVMDIHAQTRLYYVLAGIQFLMRNMHPSSDWANRLKSLVQTIPAGPNISLQQGAGFPANWESQPLWS